MSHKPFYFKQFKIEQDQCAMKIGTDGVLLGAWVDTINASTILDIGTGTGVIAIMQAQRNNTAKITGIDIDKNAATQAKENCKNSIWDKMLQILHISIQDFCANAPNKYDHIICNPPFYATQHFTLANGKARQIARSSTTLNFKELFECATQLLSNVGVFSLIIPIENLIDILDISEQNKLFLIRKTLVYPTSNKKANRVLLSFSKYNKETIEDKLVIQIGGRNEFSDKYISLTRDFYTIL